MDEQKYNVVRENITWEISTVRSWLNGYGSSCNKQGKDFSGKGFFDNAFSVSEKPAIINSTVVNGDNISYGTEGGNDTKEKVFLLSESEVYGASAVSHGFAKGKGDDEARACKSSSYAKAMGTCMYQLDGVYKGNCRWWLRSPGDISLSAVYIDEYTQVVIIVVRMNSILITVYVLL